MKIISTGRTISTPEFREKKKRRRRVRLYFLTFLTIVFLGLIIYFFRTENLHIDTISATGMHTVSELEVTSLAGLHTRGHYLWILPKKHFLIHPREELVDDLFKTFPQFRTVDLDLKGLKKLNIVIEEREPFAKYCNRPNTASSTCYFLDEGGFIFLKVATSTPNTYFTYSYSEPISDLPGKQFIAEEEFKYLTPFIESLESNTEVLATSLSISEDDYSLTLDTGADIIWKRNVSQEIILRDLGAFLADELVVDDPSFWQRVIYLDLRTPNKVFYKFR